MVPSENKRYQSATIMILIIASSVIAFLIPAQSYAEEYRCQSWGYSGFEARSQISRLQLDYDYALQKEQDPNYQPYVTERSSQEILEEINSILVECIPQIKGGVRSSYLDSSYPLIGPMSSDKACPGPWPLTSSAASSNLQAIDNRVVLLSSIQAELQIDYQTGQEMLAEERRMAGIFSDCSDYLYHAGIKDEPVHQPAPDLGPLVPSGSECIIATAAFGSNIAPQVQFLRGFRDNHILSTAAGSSFMNVFNAWYYSFSPSVAAYERGQPWMQSTVRVVIQPLLVILQLSEKGYSFIPGEFGAMSAGLISSFLIGAVYFTPLALSIKQVRKSTLHYRLSACIIATTSSALMISILFTNPIALMITTSIFVLSIISLSAVFSAKILVAFSKRMK